MSKATLHATLVHVKRFFHWLAGQPGYKSRLQYSDADYFNIAMMPAESLIQRRDRALIAFTLLAARLARGRYGESDPAMGSINRQAPPPEPGFDHNESFEEAS